jgi:curved DNA-binding protein CbpA
MSSKYEKYYKVLDLDVGASKEEVKMAFRELSQMYHPDNYSRKSPEVQKRSEEKFKELSNAYEILKDYFSEEDSSREAEEKTKAEQDRKDREDKKGQVGTDIDNPEYNPSSSGMKTVIRIILICVAGLFIIVIADIPYLLQNFPRVTDREPLTEPDRIDKELKMLPQEEQSNETTQSESIVQFGWKVSGSADPASRVIIARSARVRSDEGLCQMSVLRRPQGSRGTEFECEFKFRDEKELTIKFDNDDSYHRMIQFHGSSENTILVRPYTPDNSLDNSFEASLDRIYSLSDDGDDKGNSFRYDKFINSLISTNFVAIKLIPTEKSGPVWIRFTLKGAKEAISKLGKELETAPNISND